MSVVEAVRHRDELFVPSVVSRLVATDERMAARRGSNA